MLVLEDIQNAGALDLLRADMFRCWVVIGQKIIFPAVVTDGDPGVLQLGWQPSWSPCRNEEESAYAHNECGDSGAAYLCAGIPLTG